MVRSAPLGGDMNDSQKTENGLTLLQKLQIATAILVSVFGIYTSYKATDAANNSFKNTKLLGDFEIKLKERDSETKRLQEFTKSIQDQLPNLAGGNPIKAKISLASLYSIAPKESDKSILFTIAIVSENEAMKSTIKDLILEDPTATSDFKKEIGIKLSKRLTVISNESTVAESKSPIVKQSVVEKKMLEQLTQEQPEIIGWIYLGKTKSGSLALENDRTINSSEVPAVGSLIETLTSVNLREEAPGSRGLGAIKGILPEKSKLKVKVSKEISINPSEKAIWSQVTENSKS
jgi:hypothetical protein